MSKSNFNLYLDNETRIQAYNNLVINGYEIFKSASLIQNIDLVKNYLSKAEKNPSHKDDIDTYDIYPLTLSHLIDLVKICLFYENYMKAVLISKGFIVHIISKQRQKDLSNEQRSRPIHLEELSINERFTMDKSGNISHDSLLEQTINFSTILNKKDYKAIINLPLNIICTLNKINLKRNELHLYKEVELSLSLQYVQNVKELNRFADDLFNKN